MEINQEFKINIDCENLYLMKDVNMGLWLKVNLGGAKQGMSGRDEQYYFR